jgi:hypothetical protein
MYTCLYIHVCTEATLAKALLSMTTEKQVGLSEYAASFRSEMQRDLIKLAMRRCDRRVSAVYEQCIQWIRGSASAVAAGRGSISWPSESLQGVSEYLDMTALVKMEEAFAHCEDLCVYMATHLRPDLVAATSNWTCLRVAWEAEVPRLGARELGMGMGIGLTPPSSINAQVILG